MPRIAHAALAAVLLAPALAGANGVRHEVAIGEGSVAVRVLHHGERPLADAHFSVFAPGSPDRPRETGRTDRHGWLVFDPDATGTWRVKVADASGHGKTFEVAVPASAIDRGDAAAARTGPGPATPAHPAAGVASGESRAPAGTSGPASDEPGPMRVLAAAGALALAFLALFAVQRRRRAAGR